jgi:hypothetical protein
MLLELAETAELQVSITLQDQHRAMSVTMAEQLISITCLLQVVVVEMLDLLTEAAGPTLLQQEAMAGQADQAAAVVRVFATM